MKATKLEQLKGWVGDAWLVRLEPPFEGHELVIVSAVCNERTHETMVFPSEGPLAAIHTISLVGIANVDHVLRGAGYEVCT